MATIYDVAKYANTSISTVSHYMNKTKYVGPEKSLRIKEAIEVLSYTPNRAAKTLKTSSSNEIHIILPNLTDPLFAYTYTGISEALLTSSYTPILHLTNDLVASEVHILEQVKKSNPAGIIICSCQDPSNASLKLLDKEYTTYFLYRAPAIDHINFMSFDNTKTIYKLCNTLLQTEDMTIGLVTGLKEFSWDLDCIEGYELAFQHKKIDIDKHCIHNLPQHKEAAFKYLVELYDGLDLPRCMIASSSLFTTAIKDLYALRHEKNYILITLGYESWYNKELSRTLLQTIRESQLLGADLANSIIKSITEPTSCEKQEIIYKDKFNPIILNDLVQSPKIEYINNKSDNNTSQETLNFLLLEDSISLTAFRALLPYFEEEHNIRINITSCPYDQLYDRIQDPLILWDISSVDLPWINDLIQMDQITPIPHTEEGYPLNTHMYPLQLGLSNNTLYGIPYLIGLQLLFYREDLFKQQQHREEFYSHYSRELTPPKDWLHYNQIAKFFTRKHTKTSPTTYGTSLANYYQGSILGEILPRIWGYGGHVMDEDGFPTMSSPPVKKAFENYIEATNYSSSKNLYAEDVAREFCKGDIAMITSYVSYAPIIYDQLSSQVKGLIGFANMPSNSSMVSGWSLCLNSNTRKKTLSNAFFKWFLSPDIAYRYALLTGNPITHDLFTNSNLNKLYPWLSLSLESLEKGHTRQLFQSTNNDNTSVISSEYLEGLISKVITKQQSSRGSLHSLLKQADRDMNTI